MKHLLVTLILLVAIGATTSAATIPVTGTIEVLFSPGGGATESVVTEISAAREEILIQAYSFTSKPIAKALLEARKRGVKVEAILDKSNATAKYSAATFLTHAGIPVLIDDAHAIAHNKVMIIDRRVLITGSFNFTSAAEDKNAENMLVIKGNKALVEQFAANYERHKKHSHAWQLASGGN